VQQRRSKRARRNPSPRMIKLTVHDEVCNDTWTRLACTPRWANMYPGIEESIGSGFYSADPLLCCGNFSKEDAMFCQDKMSGVLV